MTLLFNADAQQHSWWEQLSDCCKLNSDVENDSSKAQNFMLIAWAPLVRESFIGPPIQNTLNN